MLLVQNQNHRSENSYFDFESLKDNYTKLNINKKKEDLKTFILDVAREVKRSPKRKQKQFYKTVMKSCLLILPFLPLKTANAQSVINIPQERLSFPIIDQLYDIGIIPPDIVTLLILIIQASGLIAVGLAIFLLIVSGMRMSFGQVNQSKEMNRNVILGFSVALLSPFIILLLTAFTMMMLGNVNGGIQLFSE